MAITTQDGLIAARNSRIPFAVRKASIANAAAGNIFSLWRSTGPLPSQPAIPTTAVVAVDSNAGSLGTFGNPTPPVKTYIDVIDLANTIAGRLLLVDRIIQNGGLSGTVVTAQNVNTPALPALRIPSGVSTDGRGLLWGLEWYVDTGVTAVTATISYTNQAGTAGRTTTIAVPVTCRAGRFMPITALQAGDLSIRSIETVTLSATTGTAGNFGVSCYCILGSMRVPVANVPDPAKEALLVTVDDAAHLALLMECTTTSTGDSMGEVVLVQG